MAFKMKGSAFKLGNVATKSALKDRYTITYKDDEKMANKMRAHNEQHSANPGMDHDDADSDNLTWWNVKDERPRKAQIETKYKNPDGSPKLDDQGNPLVDPDEETVPLEMKSPAKHTGSASHPTGAIAAHKGHMSKKKTIIRKGGVKKDDSPMKDRESRLRKRAKKAPTKIIGALAGMAAKAVAGKVLKKVTGGDKDK